MINLTVLVSDEAGSDYFGPLTVCAAFVTETCPYFKTLGVDDSKN